MPIVDILIVLLVVLSVLIGYARGFVKEAMSVASLLIAIWSALFLGPRVGTISDEWLSSPDLQIWFGRVLVFVVILTIGGLLGWGLSKLVRLTALGGTDRILGIVFGFCRGALLLGLAVIGGEFAGFDNDKWWEDSTLMHYGEFVSEWIKVMAPKGLELFEPGDLAESLASRAGAEFGG